MPEVWLYAHMQWTDAVLTCGIVIESDCFAFLHVSQSDKVAPLLPYNHNTIWFAAMVGVSYVPNAIHVLLFGDLHDMLKQQSLLSH